MTMQREYRYKMSYAQANKTRQHLVKSQQTNQYSVEGVGLASIVV